MPNFKSAAKRKRELAKLDKRQAKDQKRALRKAERSGPEVGTTTATATIATATQPMRASNRPEALTDPVRAPLTLAEAVERWKNTKIVRPKKR
jgi:hypothetical protein